MYYYIGDFLLPKNYKTPTPQTLMSYKIINKDILKMSDIIFQGNTIPHYWYQNLRYKNGKPNLNAIIILAEIAYWYRPVCLLDETTKQVIGYNQKLKEDLLQYSYEDFEKKFGLTHRQTRDALIFLEEKNLIKRHIKQGLPVEGYSGVKMFNVLHLSINKQKINEISNKKEGEIICKLSGEEYAR